MEKGRTGARMLKDKRGEFMALVNELVDRRPFL
jgi:hypothetical protein